MQQRSLLTESDQVRIQQRSRRWSAQSALLGRNLSADRNLERHRRDERGSLSSSGDGSRALCTLIPLHVVPKQTGESGLFVREFR